MTAIGPNPLEMVLLILLGGGFGLPSGIPPTAEDPLAQRIAPAECLFYVSWSGTGTPNAASANHTEKLLAEPEVQKFLNQAGDSFFNVMQQSQSDPAAQEAFNSIKMVVKLVRGKPGAFYISDFQMKDNAPPNIKGGGLLNMGEDGPALQKLLEGVQSKAKPGDIAEVKIGNRTFHRMVTNDGATAITWGQAGKYFLFGIGDGALEGLMQRAREQEPAWLASAKARLVVPRVSSLMYVNTKKIIDLAVASSGEPEAARVVSALGLDKIGTAVMVNGLEDKGCVMRASLSLDGGAATGVLAGLDAAPLVAADLKQIPSTSPVAVAFKLDAAKLYDLWMDLAGQIDPNAAQQMQQGMQQMEQELGLQIRADLLGSLGDTWRIYAQPGPGGLMTGWTIAIKVRDRQKLEQVQQTLTTMAKAVLQQAGPNGPKLESSEIDGHAVHTVSIGQPGAPAPSWCITDDELFVTLTAQQLKPLLSGTVAGESLAQQEDVQKLFQAGSRTLALAYIDTQQVAKTLLPFAQMGLQVATGQLGVPQMDTKNLPSQDAIVPHLQPSLFALQRTAEGVEFTSYQTLPGGNVGASAPVMVALILPAVQAAREAARRMEGANNLKQIGLAMHNFHDTYRAFPAGYSADADGNPLLSWRVHVLPFIEHQALYDQFHLDEPWDSPHNKTLIGQMPEIYRCPNSTAEAGMANYVGITGKDGVFVRPKPGERLGTRFAEILDGTSNTIMTAEVPDASAVIWTKPGDFSPNADAPTQGLTGLRPGGFQVGFADGSVRFISETIDVELFRGLLTKSGGERVNLP